MTLFNWKNSPYPNCMHYSVVSSDNVIFCCKFKALYSSTTTVARHKSGEVYIYISMC